MRGCIALTGSGRSELVHELTRLHNLGLSGGFLAISSGLALVVLPLPERRSRIMLSLRRVRFRRTPVGRRNENGQALASARPKSARKSPKVQIVDAVDTALQALDLRVSAE